MDDQNTNRPTSDAEWYCRRDPEEERFYALFFRMCRKYDVRWASATPKEQAFIEEVTRVTYERDRESVGKDEAGGSNPPGSSTESLESQRTQGF